MRSLPQAVLIDLDGTLMDTAPDLAEAANRMRADAALAPLSQARVAAFVGKGADVLVHRALTDRLDGRVDDARFAAGRAAFFRHYHAVNGRNAQVFPRVPEALAALRAAGLLLACVTNKPREFTVPLLDRMGLVAAFDAVVAGDDVIEKKPHPALLLAACARLQRAPAQTVMIGDSINDALAARAAGMPVALVQTGYNEGESVATLAHAPAAAASAPVAADGSPLAAQPGDAPLADAILPALFDAAQWVLQGMPRGASMASST
jgi:phosphoglycolate phosphatase